MYHGYAPSYLCDLLPPLARDDYSIYDDLFQIYCKVIFTFCIKIFSPPITIPRHYKLQIEAASKFILR